LPILHGGPLRLVVPGWTGNHWIKWVRAILAAEEEAPGFYQRTGYRVPRTPGAPGTEVKPEDTVPVTWMNVKSLIVSPWTEARLSPGEQDIAGVAWTGKGHVTNVEVSIDGAGWNPARLIDPPAEYEWRRWTFSWKASVGEHLIRARATDSNGHVQPERGAWNKSGYLWNGIDHVQVAVS
jgi:DMSO/TMAO reductase YedYZ molybdopterin-dependent catalytic subunit